MIQANLLHLDPKQFLVTNLKSVQYFYPLIISNHLLSSQFKILTKEFNSFLPIKEIPMLIPLIGYLKK